MTNPHSCSEDIQKTVSKALHQIRTRALRDAPVYLQHVSMAEKELQHSIMQLITRYGDQRELAILEKLRDHEADSIDELAADLSNMITARIAELKAKEVK